LRLPHLPVPSLQPYRRSGRRRLDALTTENTRPVRIHLDFQSLYQATAPAYSACFAVGQWYKKGLPTITPAFSEVTPPSDPSQATCTRTTTTNTDCWGICEARDVITESGRDKLIEAVTRIAQELSEFFAVVPVPGNLTFENSAGRYDRALQQKGYASATSCARDCTMLSGVAVAPEYCTAGVEADVVLSLTKPPVVPGAAGTGSWCVSDQNNRPLWIVFAWLLPLSQLTDSVDSIVDSKRALVYHEIIHGLGFENSAFRNAANGDGSRKGLIELKPVTDADGSMDEVWHFVKGRAYQTAQSYFGCESNTSWLGVPLMGLPELGRASHWETRVLRDDVMTYGGGPALVSSITLAAMEDLGHYLSNYSKAGCMHWGYKQGCNYVVTRCGSGINDYSNVVASSGECKGPQDEYGSWWERTPDTYLQAKCDGGTTPCAASAGFLDLLDGTKRCNAECTTSTATRTDCSLAPAGAVDGAASQESLRNQLANLLGLETTDWKFYAILGGAFFVLLLGLVILNALLCPDNGRAQRRILLVVNSIIACAAVAAFAADMYVLYAPASLPWSYPTFEPFVKKSWLVVAACVFGFLLALSLLTIWGAVMRNTLLLVCVWFVYLILLILQAILTATTAYWIVSLQDVSTDSAAAVTGEGRYDGKFGSSLLSKVENMLCGTYRTCCFDPKLLAANATFSYGNGTEPAVDVGYDAGSGAYAGGGPSASATCLHAHEGMATDLTVTLQDPSNSLFCQYVTGFTGSEFTPDTRVCPILDDLVGSFSQATCQSDFCPLGVDAYQVFVRQMVEFMQNNAVWLSIGFGVLLMFEVMIMTNAWRLRRSVLRTKDALVYAGNRDMESWERGGSAELMHHGGHHHGQQGGQHGKYNAYT